MNQGQGLDIFLLKSDSAKQPLPRRLTLRATKCDEVAASADYDCVERSGAGKCATGTLSTGVCGAFLSIFVANLRDRDHIRGGRVCFLLDLHCAVGY